MEKVSDQQLNELIRQAEKVNPELERILNCLLELKQLRAEKKRNNLIQAALNGNIKTGSAS